MATTQPLTDFERQTIALAGQLWNNLCHIVGEGDTRSADLAELIVHVHAIQHAVMSNAAARAYPNEFRLLGDTLGPCCNREHEHDGSGCLDCRCNRTPANGANGR